MSNFKDEIETALAVAAAEIDRLEISLRERKEAASYLIKHARDLGISITEISHIFGVSRNTIYKWMREINNDHCGY